MISAILPQIYGHTTDASSQASYCRVLRLNADAAFLPFITRSDRRAALSMRRLNEDIFSI